MVVPSEVLSNSNSPLLSPSRVSRAEDDVPPIPAISSHETSLVDKGGVVSSLRSVDRGKARFDFD